MQQLQQGPLAGYMPYTRQTEGVLRSLADLKPETLAVMHGSSYIGQGDRLLTDLAGVIKENLPPQQNSWVNLGWGSSRGREIGRFQCLVRFESHRTFSSSVWLCC